jgi:hypothetical protein
MGVGGSGSEVENADMQEYTGDGFAAGAVGQGKVYEMALAELGIKL